MAVGGKVEATGSRSEAGLGATAATAAKVTAEETAVADLGLEGSEAALAAMVVPES
jgi:hypothetical protein